MKLDKEPVQYHTHIFSKLEKISIPEQHIIMPDNIKPQTLNTQINNILAQENSDWEPIEFCFLINGSILKSSLKKHLKNFSVSVEDKLEIEIIEKNPSPSDDNTLDHDDWVASVRAIDDWILSGCYDNTLNIWDFQGNHINTVKAHKQPVQAVSWIQSGSDVKSFVSTSVDGNTLLWEWNSLKPKKVKCVASGKGERSGPVNCIDVHPGKDKFITGATNGTLKLWSLNSLENKDSEPPSKKSKGEHEPPNEISPVLILPAHAEIGASVMGVHWLNSKDCCTASMDHSIKIWDLELKGLKHSMKGKEAILSTSFSPLSNKIISGHMSGLVKLWDPRSTEEAIVKCSFKGSSKQVNGLAWSPVKDHLFVAGYDDNMVRLWDLRSPKTALFDLPGHEDMVQCVDWSLSSYILSGAADKKLKIYKI